MAVVKNGRACKVWRLHAAGAERASKLAGLDVAQSPSSELRARVFAAVASSPSSTRREALVRQIAFYFLGVALPVAVFLFGYGLRLDRRPDRLVVETAGGAALVAVAVGAFAFRRGASMLGRRRSWLFALVLSTPVLLLLWKVGVTTSFPDMLGVHTERRGFRCLELSCLLAPAPLAAMLLARRGTAHARPSLAGAAIGTGVGAFIWVFVDLWCPVSHVPHLLLGHVLPVVLAAAVGAIAGTWLLDLPGVARRKVLPTANASEMDTTDWAAYEQYERAGKVHLSRQSKNTT